MKTEFDFVQWLKSLPAGTTFCENERCISCPVAKFLGREIHYSDPQEWVVSFIARFDAGDHISLDDALRIAEEIFPATASGAQLL